jgi:pimeloyl-ACP methyl ester carboxylesterase
MARIQVGAVELAYDEVGDGEALVFLSGTSLDRTVWGPQVAAFAERYRCITIDNRDVGESTQVTSGYGPRDMAADVDGLLAALDLPAAHVVGHSLGGAIGQSSRSPPRSGAPSADRQLGPERRVHRALFRTWKRLRTTLEPAAFLEAILLTGVRHTFLNTIGVDAMVQLFLGAPNPQSAEGYCRQVDADLAHDTLDRLGKIQPPTLVIAGDEDKIFRPTTPVSSPTGSALELVAIAAPGTARDRESRRGERRPRDLLHLALIERRNQDRGFTPRRRPSGSARSADRTGRNSVAARSAGARIAEGRVPTASRLCDAGRRKATRAAQYWVAARSSSSTSIAGAGRARRWRSGGSTPTGMWRRLASYWSARRSSAPATPGLSTSTRNAQGRMPRATSCKAARPWRAHSTSTPVAVK